MTGTLLWLDLETTGLDPVKGHILEVGAILTTMDHPWLQTDAVRRSFVLPFNLDEHDVPDVVRQMHERSGLAAECLDRLRRGDPYDASLSEAENALLDILPSPLEQPEAPYLAGSTVHFDLGWVRRHMPRLALRLHYRIYDISSTVLFCRSLGMPKPEELKDKPHRALTDLDNSIAYVGKCAEWLEQRGG